jgi:xylan 1,4-beta-xylosidase
MHLIKENKYFFVLISTIVCISICSCIREDSTSSKSAVEYTVDVDTTIGEIHEFWKSIGYDFLFKIVNEPEGQEFLDKAEKEQSVRYFRTHYTFNNSASGDKKAGGNTCGNVVFRDSDGNIQYDFSKVNNTFREYVKRGMKPIVELDYYPDGFSENSLQNVNDEALEARSGAPVSWEDWQDLLDRFMQNLVDEFGKEELKTWYFEVWNEPDGWSREELPDFYRLYDVFAHTVKSYDKDFKVGGPSCYNLYFMKEFLDHVVYGTNYVTGETGSPVDFLSYHIYGLSGSWLKPAPDIWPMVSKFTADMLWWQRLVRKYPGMSDVEMHLNEWGVCSHGDSKFVAEFPQLEYRNSEFSALFMVKLVDCLFAIEDNYDFRTELMLYWGAWFNAATGPIFMGSRDLMTSGNIPKPIMTAYEMLANLGTTRLQVAGPKPGGRFGLLATRSEKDLQILAYNFQETDDNFNQEDNFVINLEHLSGEGDLTVKEYRMDQLHNNTYRKWERMGKPEADEEIINQLREEGVLKVTNTFTLKTSDGQAFWKDRLARHSMCLYTIEMSDLEE